MKKLIQRTVIVSSLVLGATSVALACDGKKKESSNTSKEVQMRLQASADETGTSEIGTPVEREKKGFKSLILTRERVGVKGTGDY